MCSDEQVAVQLALLTKIAQSLEPRPDIDRTIFLSSTQPYQIDYQNRSYIFIYSQNNLTLTIEEFGTLTITAGTWNNMNFQQGMRIFAQGQATLVPLLVRCTDTLLALDTISNVSLAPNSSVNVNQVAGTATDTNSGNKSAGTQRVVLATDQPQLTNALKVDGSAVVQPTTLGDGVTPATKVSVGLTHNADNQNLANVNSVFTAGVAAIVSPIGTGNRQLEVSTDGTPSHGITSSTQNLAQTQSSNATGVIAQGQTTNAVITPTTMTSAMVQYNEVDVDFGTANQEAGYIVSTTGTTITVQPVNGSPSAPSWKFAHSGTYKVQVRAYNVMRDIKGENSGFDGTGMPPAVEVEWGSGGPPLASGLPSLDQYDRETLIVGQGLQTQAITSTLVGDTQITMTGAVKTLTPGHPIQLSGSGTLETVYVDQSYVLGNNTVIALKHPVVNAAQITAKWQMYNPSGPLSNLFLLYGEAMEGIVLSDLANPGMGTMQQNARSNGAPYQASALEAVGLDNGATLDKWKSGAQAGAALTDPADRWARQVGQIDVARVLGATLSISNPMLQETNIQNAIRNGQGFVASAKGTTAGAANVGLSVFNPAASGKNILIYSILYGANNNSTSIISLNSVTADPALGTAVTVANRKIGGAASAIAATVSSTNANVAAAGTVILNMTCGANNVQDAISNGGTFLLPNGSAEGLVLYFNFAAAQSWVATFAWIEF